ncbi:MAG: TetR/AcrR family transcriptional regulator, partial [Clostridiales bacterium]
AFDAQCIGYYQEALAHITLREGVSEKNALSYFSLLQKLFNQYFQDNIAANVDFDSLMQTHEDQLSNILNIMLYGIAKENVK